MAVVVPASGGDVGEGSDWAVEAVGAYEKARREGRATGGEGDVRVGGEVQCFWRGWRWGEMDRGDGGFVEGDD